MIMMRTWALVSRNYLLSLKPAPLRMALEWTGSKTDRQARVEQLKQATLRDKQTDLAKGIPRELHHRFPNNPWYLKEIERLDPRH